MMADESREIGLRAQCRIAFDRFVFYYSPANSPDGGAVAHRQRARSVGLRAR
jgi:hypothetical protein